MFRTVLLTALRALAPQVRIGISTLLLGAMPALVCAQTPLVNGGNHSGTISAGNPIDAYTFNGTAGENVTLRVGSTNFAPNIELHGPGGALLQSVPATAPGGGSRDQLISLHLTTSGLYTVDVSSYYNNGAGTYALRFAQVPGVFTVPAGDEGGVITNGTRRTGVIDIGDLDLWRFDANAGDSIQLRVGATNLIPQIDLYGPDGALIQTVPSQPPGGGSRDAVISMRLTVGGTYTAVVSETSFYLANSLSTPGTYALSFAQAPGTFQTSAGDEGGPLTNGARVTGTIDIGDLDMWSFAGNTGDTIQLRIGATNLIPQMDLYGPDGALIQTVPTQAPGGGNRDELISLRLTTNGNYTVVVSETSFYLANSLSTPGTYALSFAQAPGAFQTSTGDEGGALTNGTKVSGTIDIGDLDMWSFTANSGDSIQLRVGADNLIPQLDLYGPDGALVQSVPAQPPGGGSRDQSISLRLTAGGNYTVVVSETTFYLANSLSTPGTYTLSFVKVPGQIVVPPGGGGGTLTNGLSQTGTINAGNFDAWTFTGTAGDNIQLRVGGTNLIPQLDLYGPDGTPIQSVPTSPPGGGSRDQQILAQLTTNGLFTVVVSETSFYPANSLSAPGTYSLTLVHPPDPVFVSPGDEGGALTNGYTIAGTNAVGDIDVWSFYGTPGDSNSFRLGTVDFTPWLRLYGPDGKLVKEVFTASQNRTNSMSFVVTNAGDYTLVSSAYFLNQFGTYNLKQSRLPPDLNMAATVSVDEETTVNIPISAQDPDTPNKALVFALQGQPAGMNIINAGATNATISWATTELDGPQTYVFLVTVTDLATLTGQPFTRTNTLTVIVNEVNRPPVLTVPADLAINELTPLAVTASATDPDLPKNPLTFSLDSAPDGVNIDPITGAISWVPTELQGPGSYKIGVVVTDDSPSAVNAKNLSVTNTFTVTVNEVNLPPQITIADAVVDEGQTLNLPITLTDLDLPSNGHTFALVSGPQGLTVNPTTGAISWTPTEAQGPNTNAVTVMVTDDNPAAVNDQHLTGIATFNIVVNEVNLPPTLPVIGPQTIDELKTLTITNTASDPDIPANILVYTLVNPPAGASISPAGIITWTPTEAQGPTNLTLTTIVTDNGVPPLTATNSFTVAVNEINTAPSIADIGPQTVNTGSLLTISTSVTDSDLPPNKVVLSLDNAPTGMTVDPATGVITWTPADEQAGVYSVSLKATDDGVPPLSQTNTFQVTAIKVVPTGGQLAISLLPGNSIQIQVTGDPGRTYDLESSTDLKNWDSLGQISLSLTSGTFQKRDLATSSHLFYRLKLIQ